MCDLIQQNGFWAILGTIMGFLLYEVAGFVKSLGSVILSDNEESLMPLRTMLWRFFTSFKNDIFSPFYETILIDSQ